ncbi:MAG: UDP-N-acetylmuramoyl-L-alanyl-D-glutamate--2,6-diaminopimelate ligase [Gammaproteobacteria bacterium]
MNLSTLLENFITQPLIQDPEVMGLALDSRHVLPGYIFIACVGQTVDGRDYIDEAIAKGAVAIIAASTGNAVYSHLAERRQIPIITLEHLQEKLGWIAARFYHNPSQQMKIIGITGTAGKTSCAEWIAAALESPENPCGVIGTLRSGAQTTPDAICVQKTLATFLQQGIKIVVMEVSSHALAQGRVNGVKFDVGMFTNLSRDHLDYHQDMESYAKAKRRLFERFDLRYAVINVDDEYGQKLLQELPGTLQLWGYTTRKLHAKLKHFSMVQADKVKLKSTGISARVTTPWGTGVLQNPLLGHFNLSNLLGVLTIVSIMGVPFDEALIKINAMRGVPGRMEVLGGGELPLVIVDYAHKPGALEQVLSTLREYCKGKLWCVFGCGGDRDRGKRPLMGQIVEKYADHMVITDDNPRCESPASIVKDILQGLSAHVAAVVEHDRRRAIAYAIQCARAGDMVLIAGKGHEKYQQMGTETLPFCDIIEAKRCLTKI